LKCKVVLLEDYTKLKQNLLNNIRIPFVGS